MSILIIGLGNPGEKYQNTRHNVGFKIVEELADNFQFPAFEFKNINHSLVSKGILARQKAVLAKPQTFMNASGKAVRQLVKNFKPKDQGWLIVHDDIDLPLGKIKLVKNRGAAGHRGIESIIKELKTKDFARLRIGICPQDRRPKNPERFVLQKFKKAEGRILKEPAKKALKALELFAESGPEKAMAESNQK